MSIPQGQPGWFAEASAKAHISIAQHEREKSYDSEAITLLRDLGRSLGFGLARWQLWRASNYLRDRDGLLMAMLERESHIAIINRRARHDRTCDCGALI